MRLIRALAHIARRALRQPPAMWRDLLRAQVALILAQLEIWVRPRGQLVDDVAPVQAEAAQAPPPQDEIAPDLVRLATAVRFAASHGVFRPKCLVRAIALNRMLRRAGVSRSRIRIGVRFEEGRFEAHAWVELGSSVLGDRRDRVSRFAQLADLELSR